MSETNCPHQTHLTVDAKCVPDHQGHHHVVEAGIVWVAVADAGAVVADESSGEISNNKSYKKRYK